MVCSDIPKIFEEISVSGRGRRESETTIHYGKRLRSDPKLRAQYDKTLAGESRRSLKPVSGVTKTEDVHIFIKSHTKP